MTMVMQRSAVVVRTNMELPTESVGIKIFTFLPPVLTQAAMGGVKLSLWVFERTIYVNIFSPVQSGWLGYKFVCSSTLVDLRPAGALSQVGPTRSRLLRGLSNSCGCGRMSLYRWLR